MASPLEVKFESSSLKVWVEAPKSEHRKMKNQRAEKITAAPKPECRSAEIRAPKNEKPERRKNTAAPNSECRKTHAKRWMLKAPLLILGSTFISIIV